MTWDGGHEEALIEIFFFFNCFPFLARSFKEEAALATDPCFVGFLLWRYLIFI